MSRKIILLIAGLLVLGWIGVSLFRLAQHPAAEQARWVVAEKAKILLANLGQSLAPQRKPPLSTIELEEHLKLNLPKPFAEFEQEDWQWFWRLLYGRFAEDPSSAWPKRVRQLTKEEVEQTLVDYYNHPFDYFDERQWGIFWQQILKGRVFKQ